MTIIKNDVSFQSLGLIRQTDNGIKEMKVMTLRNKSIVPTSAEKYLVVNNGAEASKEITFILIVSRRIGEKINKEYFTVRVRNPYVFYGHHSVLKLQFTLNGGNQISMKIVKSLLSVEEDVPDSDIQISSGFNSINLAAVKNMYSTYYTGTNEKLAWVCLLFDTGMVDNNKFCNRRSNLINKFFFKASAKFSNAFFSIITFGGSSESYVKIDNRFISDTTGRIMDSISEIELYPGSNLRCNPFNSLFKIFNGIKEFNAKYNPELDISFNVVMITDGELFTDDITNGFCQMRDDLKVNVFCIGGDDNNKQLRTICNCKDWNDFFSKNQLDANNT